MRTKHALRFYLLFTALLVFTAYILGLFIDLTGDAGKYAAITRHILESGDFINLKIHGEPYDQKPPLLFWLAAIGFKIGGFHNWAFKLFPILYGCAGFWFTYKLGKTLYNKATGKIAAIMLATSWAFFMFSMDVHMDLILQANVTLAIWQLTVYQRTQKPANFIWAFIGVGLAMMSKGPVGAAVPMFALGTHLLIKREFKQLFHTKWILGIFISLVICLPAFIGLYNQFGLQGIKFFFVTNNLGRITGAYAGNNNDLFFYLHTLLYLLLPWTFLFLFGFYHEIRSYFKTPHQQREYFTTGGIWLFFLIISIAKGKAPHYIFMLIPMILVVVAKWINTFSSITKTMNKLQYFQTGANSLIIVLYLFLMIYLFPSKNIIYWGLLATATGVSIYVLRNSNSVQIRLFLPSAILMTSLIIYLNAHALPAAFSYQASTKASTLYNRLSSGKEPLYNYLYSQYELFFYSHTDAERLYSIKDFTPDANKSSWIFTTEAGKDTITNVFANQIEEIYPFLHKGMSTLSPQFINPATRQKTLDNMYLIKLQPTHEHLVMSINILSEK